MPAIITSRTRRLYLRPPDPPWCLNRQHPAARGIVAYWPLGDRTTLFVRDHAAGNFHLTHNNTPDIGAGPNGGLAQIYNGVDEDHEIETGVVGTTPVPPFTFECWFNSISASTQQALIVTMNGDTGTRWYILELGGHVVGDPVRAQAHDPSAGEAFAATTTGYSVNKWHHGAAVFTATNSRTAYIDGGSPGTETASRTDVTSISRTALGAFRGGASYFSPFNGRMVEAVVRSVASSPSELLDRWSPATRWALRYPLRRRTFSFVSGGAAPIVAWIKA